MLPRLNDATFDRAIQSSAPILVIFTAPKRCAACRAQKPALEALQQEGYPVYLVDVEEPDTAHIEKTRGGRGVPFFKVYANGQLISEHLGQLDAGHAMGFFKNGVELAQQIAPYRARTGQGSASISGVLAGYGLR